MISSELRDTLKKPVLRQRGMGKLLQEQEISFGGNPDNEAFSNLESGRQVLVSGQQCGLLGGPVMSLWKALGLVRIADLIEAEGMERPLCVFWLESNDHDWTEAATSGFPVSQVPNPPESANKGASVGRITLDKAWWQGFAEQLEPGLQTAALDLAESSSLPVQFGRILRRFFTTDELLLLNPSSAACRSLAFPFFQQLKQIGTVSSALIHADTEALLESGRTAPVKTDDRSPWFVTDDAGHRHRPSIEDPLPDADRLSPNVLSRPLLQDFLLGPALSLLGPTELKYHGQISSLRAELGLESPVLQARPHLQLLRVQDEDLLTKAGIDPWNAPQPGSPWPENVLAGLGGGASWVKDRKENLQDAEAIVTRTDKWAEASGRQDLKKRTARLKELAQQLNEQVTQVHKSGHKATLKALHQVGLWQDGTIGPQERRVNTLALLDRCGGQAMLGELRKVLDPFRQDQQRFRISQSRDHRITITQLQQS